MEVIYVNFNNSFKWASGMYMIIEETDEVYNMCKLNNGIPELDMDGGYSISCTGKNNKGIVRTNLWYHENINKQIRKEKLKKLSK